MKACTIQPPFCTEFDKSEEYFEKLTAYMDACDETMDLIVLPEYSNVPCSARTKEEAEETFAMFGARLMEKAKETREYVFDDGKYPNWFDASYVSWLSYDSLNVELPDGYLYFPPIINWGRYRKEGDRLLMPVTVRLNHAIADGFLVANVYRTLQKEIESFVK